MARLKLLIFLCFSVIVVRAQDTKTVLFGAETGFISMMTELNNNDHIRGYVSYPQGYYSASIISACNNGYFGVKAERIFGDNAHWGIASGIRYSKISNVITDNGFHYNSTGYFYWKYKEYQDKTEYLKIENIYQSSHYLGIPFELKYFISVPVKLRLYIKLGAELNFLVSNNNEIDFKDSDMDKYEGEISAQIADPNNINAAIYGAGGFKYGKDDKLSISLELTAPYGNITSTNSSFVKSYTGAGFQLSVQYPLNKLK